MVLVEGLVVLDSQSVLMSSNVLSPVEGSVVAHLGSDLELSAIWKWLSSPVDVLLVDVPALVVAVVAVPEDNMSVVTVVSTMNIEALATVVSDVSSVSRVPLDSLSVVSSPWSHGGGNSDSEASSLLVGNHEASLVEGSDGLSSSVEGEPLLVLGWVVVSDSESELVSSDVLVVEEGSVVWHHRSDLELDTGSQWVLWIVNSSSVDPPSLVGVVVALVPDDVSVVSV